MKYAHIISEVLRHPWAILDGKFDAIVSVLARREAGERLEDEQIEAIVAEGHKRLECLPYTVDEAGERILGSAALGMAAASTGAKGKLTAVIPVYGMILPRAADFSMSESGTSIEGLRAQFRSALNNADVKTILFNFDSPGGSVYHVDEFAQEIFGARGQKKILAQVDPLAASAAYYLASQTDSIAITPSGEAGSIGVRMMHQDLSKALEMKGIKVTNITYGKYKVENNPFEPMSEEGMAFAQQRVDEYGDMFVKAVARGRGVKVSDVKENFGQGRVFGAGEAKSRGMVDRIATLDETLARLGVTSDSQKVPMNAQQVSGHAAGESVVNTATAGKRTEVQAMDEATVQASATAADEVRNAERNRVAQIMQLANLHGVQAKAEKWMADGATVDQVRAEILAGMQPKAIQQRPAEHRAEVIADEHDKLPKGALTGRALRAIAGAHKTRMAPAKFASATLRDSRLASMFEATTGQTAGGFETGGFMLGETLSSDIIELLRPEAVVRSLQPTSAPLVNGSLGLAKLTGGTIAYYVGENKAITPSKIKGGQVKASAKRLAGIVLISNDLLRWAPVSADTMTRDDAIASIAGAEDVAFIRNAGTQWSPKGLKYWTPAANQIAANATVNLANTFVDLGKLMLALRNANSRMRRPGWIVSARTWYYLMFVAADTVGNHPFQAEMLQGRLLGYPYRVTSQVPDNLGTGANESEIYFADFADVVITDAPAIGVEISTEAAIDDGAGNLTSIFSTDQTALRLIVEHDLVVRHDESLAMLTGVTWGA